MLVHMLKKAETHNTLNVNVQKHYKYPATKNNPYYLIILSDVSINYTDDCKVKGEGLFINWRLNRTYKRMIKTYEVIKKISKKTEVQDLLDK